MADPLDALRKAQTIGVDRRAELTRELDVDRKEASIPDPENPAGTMATMLQRIWNGVSHFDPLVRDGEKELPQHAAPLIEHLNNYVADAPTLRHMLAESRVTPRMGRPP